MSPHDPPSDPPSFATARGTVTTWIDPLRSRSAAGHEARLRYRHLVASQDASRRADPNDDERLQQFQRAARDQDPEWDERQLRPPTPDLPDVWEVGGAVHQVRVLNPDRSATVSLRRRGADLVPTGKTVVTPRSWLFWALEGPPVARQGVRSAWSRDRDDLSAYCAGPHPPEALALLQPRCFFWGRYLDLLPDRGVETTLLDRPAHVLPLRRTIPLDDPRILGHDLNPRVLGEAEHTEVVVDREHQVVLEWRALFDGEVYERHAFTEIRFDEPLREEEFEIGL